MGQDPGAIRADIEATREHMGKTVDALTAKTSGPARAKQQAIATKDGLMNRATATKNDLVGRARGYAAHPGQAAGQTKTQARRARATARNDPKSLASVAGTAAALVAGFVALATRARHRQSSPSRPPSRSPRRRPAAARRGRMPRRGRWRDG